MIQVGYYNGRIEPLETLMIPAGDRAVYFGDGVYEALLFRGREHDRERERGRVRA